MMTLQHYDFGLHENLTRGLISSEQCSVYASLVSLPPVIHSITDTYGTLKSGQHGFETWATVNTRGWADTSKPMTAVNDFYSDFPHIPPVEKHHKST